MKVLHIELRRWANVFVVAPLDANTLGKLAHGVCDNLLSSVARCWDVRAGSMVVAPAMNTVMWTHPATQPAIDVLQSWGIVVVSPVVKTLACGDTGVGAMAGIPDIVAAVSKALKK